MRTIKREFPPSSSSSSSSSFPLPPPSLSRFKYPAPVPPSCHHRVSWISLPSASKRQSRRRSQQHAHVALLLLNTVLDRAITQDPGGLPPLCLSPCMFRIRAGYAIRRGQVTCICRRRRLILMLQDALLLLTALPEKQTPTTDSLSSPVSRRLFDPFLAFN
jgi:hypothetical protein